MFTIWLCGDPLLQMWAESSIKKNIEMEGLSIYGLKVIGCDMPTTRNPLL